MLGEVFDASQKSFEDIIMKEKTKDLKTRQEDVDFLMIRKDYLFKKCWAIIIFHKTL